MFGRSAGGWQAGRLERRGSRSQGFVTRSCPRPPPLGAPLFPPATLLSFRMARSTSSDFDPLSFALQPPSGETEELRAVRLQREVEEKLISDAIDEELRAERENQKYKRGGQSDVKLLLLGLLCQLFWRRRC